QNSKASLVRQLRPFGNGEIHLKVCQLSPHHLPPRQSHPPGPGPSPQSATPTALRASLRLPNFQQPFSREGDSAGSGVCHRSAWITQSDKEQKEHLNRCSS